MSLPKKKVSKSKRDMRRSHHRQDNAPVSLSICPRCASPKRAHRVCITCGYYKDREVIVMDKA